MMAALRMPASENATDDLKECLQMWDDPVLLTAKRFYEKEMKVFREEYLRRPKEAERSPILCTFAARSLAECTNIINCRYWQERNCRVA